MGGGCPFPEQWVAQSNDLERAAERERLSRNTEARVLERSNAAVAAFSLWRCWGIAALRG